MKKSTPYMNAYSVTTYPQKVAHGYWIYFVARINIDRVYLTVHEAKHDSQLAVFGKLPMTLAEYNAAFEHITDDGEYFNKAAGLMGVELLP